MPAVEGFILPQGGRDDDSDGSGELGRRSGGFGHLDRSTILPVRGARAGTALPCRASGAAGTEPSLTAGGYVLSILFGSVRCLFFRVTP